jgi:signal transduction histidine kinase
MHGESQRTSQQGYDAGLVAGLLESWARGGGARATLTGDSLRTDKDLEDQAEVKQAERTRIAQELHDTLLQGFLGISLQLHAAVDRLPAQCSEKRRFIEILRSMSQVVEEGRFALQGLSSPNSRIASLGEAFARIPKDFGIPSTVDFRVVVLGSELELRAGTVDEVYRIGREAIVNACLHSQAREIEAEVEYRPSELRIAVRDNGCGIGAQDLQFGRDGHWGLRGMRERAERIGARLRFWSGVALGTEVELCVPGRLAFQHMEGRAVS